MPTVNGHYSIGKSPSLIKFNPMDNKYHPFIRSMWTVKRIYGALTLGLYLLALRCNIPGISFSIFQNIEQN